MSLDHQQMHAHYLGGRRRVQVADEEYLNPKDAMEDRRLNLQHRMHILTLGAPILAPIGQDVRRMLDVGSGTNIWGREVARAYPHAEVVALDADPDPEQRARANIKEYPENCTFVEANALAGLPFPDGCFDYVHGRYFSSWVHLFEWPKLLAEMVRVCRPGGAVEIADGGAASSPSPAMLALKRGIVRFADMHGLVHAPGANLDIWLHDANLGNIHLETFLAGRNNPKVQRLILENMTLGFAGIKQALLSTRLFTEESLAATLAALPEEVRQLGIVMPISVAWGLKPGAATIIH